MEVNILGTCYRIEHKTPKEDVKLKQVEAYCDYSVKKIVLTKNRTKDDLDLKDLKMINRKILRHEIIHAFMYESGLWENSFEIRAWAQNEEMTDWFAIQLPKIFKVYEDLGILE